MKNKLEAIWNVITSEVYTVITEDNKSETLKVKVIAQCDDESTKSVVTSVIKALQEYASSESDS